MSNISTPIPQCVLDTITLQKAALSGQIPKLQNAVTTAQKALDAAIAELQAAQQHFDAHDQFLAEMKAANQENPSA